MVVRRSLEISCEHVWREISNLIDNDVDPQLRARMEEHFKGCAHCKAIYDGTSNTVKLIADKQAFEVPTRFSKNLYTKLLHHAPKKRRR
jgi:predicted anti-sigma-YlaC factor YlaD